MQNIKIIHVENNEDFFFAHKKVFFWKSNFEPINKMPLNKVMRLNFLLTIKKAKFISFFFQTIILFIKSNDSAVF